MDDHDYRGTIQMFRSVMKIIRDTKYGPLEDYANRLDRPPDELELIRSMVAMKVLLDKGLI